MMGDLNDKTIKDHKLYSFIIFLVLVIIIWGLSIYAVSIYYAELDDRSKFGSSFGVINSLFSGLAFAGIIYTILLQRTELALQRKELEATREVLMQTAAAQKESAKELRRQSNNMKQTAKLNALNTLVNHCENLIRSSVSPITTSKAKIDRNNYIEEIRAILEVKEQQ